MAVHIQVCSSWLFIHECGCSSFHMAFHIRVWMFKLSHVFSYTSVDFRITVVYIRVHFSSSYMAIVTIDMGMRYSRCYMAIDVGVGFPLIMSSIPQTQSQTHTQRHFLNKKMNTHKQVDENACFPSVDTERKWLVNLNSWS